ASREILSLGLNAQVCGSARTLKGDLDAAIDCDVDYIHTFIGTSPLHREFKLKMSKEDILSKAVDAVEYIKDHGIVAEFSAEDATRTEFDYLSEIYQAVEEVNRSFALRLLAAAKKDANVNAMVNLDCQAKLVPFTIEDLLEEMEGYFVALLEQ
ncbi:MAG: hypothetical protein HGB26_07950, partial [Desulfobulbaceae bacterium]|nr:hypothetical protein [Desulfobulbaceae bacterium]